MNSLQYKNFELEVNLDTIPIHMKSGLSIPLAKNVRGTASETLATGIEIKNYGENPKGYLYRDDKTTLSYCKREFELLQLPDLMRIFPGSG